MRIVNKPSVVTLVLMGAALMLAACSADSPTEPQQNPQPPGTTPSTSWSISVTASPASLVSGGTDPSTITVSVRRADNGQPPPDNTTASITTSFGEFNSIGSAQTSGAVNLVGGNAQLLLFPGEFAGNAQVRVQLENSVGTANVQIIDRGTFFVSSVSPASGGIEGGTTITVEGQGFFGPAQLIFRSQGTTGSTIGDVFADVVSVSPTQIRARTRSIPENLIFSDELFDLEVTVGANTGEQQTQLLVGAFTYIIDTGRQPALFSVTPASGPNEGGTRVTLTGENFESPVQVLFGQGDTTNFSGIEATVESVSPSQIVAITPTATGFGQDLRDQDVDILVRNLSSGRAAVFNTAFRYGVGILVTSISPSEGPADGGQLVTVFGQGFDEPVAVEMAGVGQQIVSVTGTEIIVRTVGVETDDCQDVSGPTIVTNIETGATGTGPIYQYDVNELAPFITGVSPTTLSAAGGESVTITGGNFTQPLQVTVDGNLVNVTSVTTGSIVFTSPFIDQNDLDVEDCDDNNDGTLGERFVATALEQEVDVILLGSGCQIDGAPTVSFVYQPTDTTCRNDVGPPDEIADPNANFSAVINGFVVDFVNTSTDAVAYLWDFGDGSPTSTEFSPTHDYTAAGAGTYTVRLTARNSVGVEDVSVQTVTVPGP